MTLRHDSPGVKTARPIGFLLCLAALSLNVWAVGQIVAPDGHIEGGTKRNAVIAGQVGLLAVGLWLVVRGGRVRLPNAARMVGLALSCFGIALGAYGSARHILHPAHGKHAVVDRNFEEMCAFATRGDPYSGTILLEEYAQKLADALDGGDDTLAVVTAREEYAEILLRHGRNDEAVAELEKGLDLAVTSGLSADSINRVRRALGIAHMRRGEASHCIDMHNPDSCLFPIEGGGVWSNPEGAVSAIAYFEAYLRERPEDLDVRWLLNVANMTAGTYPDGVPGQWLISRDLIDSPDTSVGRFRDIAGELGVDTFNICGGAIMEDFDGDGALDLFTTSSGVCEQARYYHNNGDGTFEDWTERAGLMGQLGGFNCIQADYDNDGRIDIFILRGAWQDMLYGRQRNSLLRQEEGNRFRDVTEEAGLAETIYPTQVGDWGDYDGDGDLDLFIGNEWCPSELYRNEGDGTFTDVAEAAGVLNEFEGKVFGFACAKGADWGDYDNDGDPDLFLSNYGQPNRLYRNDGDGTFTDVAVDLGLDLGVAPPKVPQRGMVPALAKNVTRARGRDVTFATWFWDVNNDGWLDIYVSGFLASLADLAADFIGEETEGRRLRVYLNDGRGGFTNMAAEMDLDDVQIPMGANYGDVDNDGFPDIYLGTGRPGFEFLVPNVLYRNVEGERFVNVTTAAGVGHLQKGHGIAFGDLDNDGDQDIYAQMGGGYPADAFRDALFENPGNENRWIVVRTRGVQSNRFGVGARIRADVVTPDGNRSFHVVVGSGGSFGASSLQAEMGLGRAERIERLEVHWPTSGTTQTFLDVPLDTCFEVTEGEDELRIVPRETIELAG